MYQLKINNTGEQQNVMVSICIPTYARFEYLQQTVESALNQTYDNFEICVSQNPKQNGPDKEIKSWCELMASKGKLRYNLNQQNLGLSGNLNKLACMAKGAFVIFIGDDDLLDNDFLKLITRPVNNKTGVVFCNQYFINESGNILGETTLSLNKNYGRALLKEGLISQSINTIFKNSVPLSASIIKRELVIKNPFHLDINTPELPFFLNIALQGNEFYYVDKQLAYYRIHSNSETARGLSTGKLLKIVIGINVPEASFLQKKYFVEPRIIPAINASLKMGDKELAGFLLKSEFYPNKKRTKKLLQSILLLIPDKINRKIFYFI